MYGDMILGLRVACDKFKLINGEGVYFRGLFAQCIDLPFAFFSFHSPSRVPSSLHGVSPSFSGVSSSFFLRSISRLFIIFLALFLFAIFIFFILPATCVETSFGGASPFVSLGTTFWRLAGTANKALTLQKITRITH